MNMSQALTFDDVLIQPQHSSIRLSEISLETQLARGLTLQLPLLSAAMDQVTGSRLAIAMALEGGMGIIHKNCSIEQQVNAINQVKQHQCGLIRDPITVSPQTSVVELKALMHRYQISGVPVVTDRKLMGMVTHRDIRFTDHRRTVSQVMTPKEQLITVTEYTSLNDVVTLLQRHRLEKLPMIDGERQLKGLYVARDLSVYQSKTLASKDNQLRLQVGAAVGTGPAEQERAEALLAAGVDILVIDTAHGHSQRVIEQVSWLKQQTSLPVVAGNVASGSGALALVDAGADAVKVGIGPGSICTTRIVTGVGVPQLTAILSVAEALNGYDVPIIADGGIRGSGDLCKALAAGATSVMVGSLLAGTLEAPGDIITIDGRSYKHYRGMGSLSAMAQQHGSSDRYGQEHQSQTEKLVPEGVEAHVPYTGPLAKTVHQLMGGLRSSMGYTGARCLAEFHRQAEFVRLTPAGLRESHVHDVNMAIQTSSSNPSS